MDLDLSPHPTSPLSLSSPPPQIRPTSLRSPATRIRSQTKTTREILPTSPSSHLSSPSRPPKSPSRPRIPSLRRITSSPVDRTRNQSTLSAAGVEFLRGVLRTFRTSLRLEGEDAEGLEAKPLPTLDSHMASADKRPSLRLISDSHEARSPRKGHRRTHSSPGSSATAEIRARTRKMSGGTFGRFVDLGTDTKDDERRSARGASGSTSDEASTQQPRIESSLPSLFIPAPPIPLPSPPNDTPSMGSLAVTTGPRPTMTTPIPSVSAPPEVRVIRPSLPPSAPAPPPIPTPSSGPEPLQTSARVHPFAAVVAMMESGDSPTRQGAKRILELDSPSRDKGKKRDAGERPNEVTTKREGRAQTPRRGLIGPGGIICGS